MTSGGKVRIYELSRDLDLVNRDVLNAAEKLSIAAKSHSSSISDGEAAKIKALLNGKAAGGAKSAAKPEAGNQILSLKKAPSTPSQSAAAPPSAPPSRKPEIVAKPAAPASPAKPAPSAPPSRKPEVVAKPAAPASPAKPAPSAPPSRKP